MKMFHTSDDDLFVKLLRSLNGRNDVVKVYLLMSLKRSDFSTQFNIFPRNTNTHNKCILKKGISS